MSRILYKNLIFQIATDCSYGDYKTETPSTSHEVTLHVAFVHAFVNPALFIALHKGLRKAAVDLICCNFRYYITGKAQKPGNINPGTGKLIIR